jgi:hypothetical protein
MQIDQLVTNLQGTKIGKIKGMFGETHALTEWQDNNIPVIEHVDNLLDYTIPIQAEQPVVVATAIETSLPFDAPEEIHPDMTISTNDKGVTKITEKKKSK